jgi:hypothetical protein
MQLYLNKQHGSRINHTKQHSSSKNIWEKQPKHMDTTCIHPNQKREIGITKAAASVEKTV